MQREKARVLLKGSLHMQIRNDIASLFHADMKEVPTNGCSTSAFYKSNDAFLKITDTSKDWLCLRSSDTGREFEVLRSLNGSELWDIFDNPYIAAAKEGAMYGLLMKRLDGVLFDKHYDILHHELVVQSMAKLHALFWEDKRIAEMSSLMNLTDFWKIIGIWNGYANTAQPIGISVLTGWEKAKTLLSDKALQYLLDYENNAVRFAGLPNTLLHGDYRPTNLGYDKKTQKLTVIDFAFCGYAPCSVDLFWYLATAMHYGLDFERTVKFYRQSLEAEIGCLDNTLWNDLYRVGIISACYMQLWEKALDYEHDKQDFNFWVYQLERAIGETKV